MDVKYVIIDLSKIDGDKLSEMLSKAYEDGYKDGKNSVAIINAPTIPYNGDQWYSTTTNTITNDASKTLLDAKMFVWEPPSANYIKAAISSD